MPTHFIAEQYRRAYFVQMPAIVKIKDSKGKVTGEKKAYYIPGISEIYEDEIIRKYGKDKLKDAVQPFMKLGKLTVGDDETSLKKFMSVHPGNQANGGNKFRELDIHKEEILETDTIDTIIEALRLLKDSKDSQKKGLAIQYLGMGYRNKTVHKCYIDLVKKIENDRKNNFAGKVIKWFSDKVNEVILTITLAIENDVLTFRNGKEVYLLGVTTEDPDELLYNCKSQSDAIREFALFLKTKEGLQVLKKISDRM